MKIFTEHQIHSIANGMMHTDDFAGREHRRHLRRFAAMDIMCMRPGEGGARSADKCILANISKSGIAMESLKNYVIGDKVLLVFTASASMAVAIEAEIVRSREGEFGKLYGAKYTETNPKRIEEFNAYILKYFNLY